MISRLYRSAYVFFEGRWASPFWRWVTRLAEFFRFQAFLVWRRRQRHGAFKTGELFCTIPFENFELQENGSAYLCCPSWLPRSVGNLHFQSSEEVCNSLAAQEIRASILDGSFKYCRLDLCPRYQNGSLPTRAGASQVKRHQEAIEGGLTKLDRRPRFYNFSNDRSCNLACPSCRTKRIQHSDGRGYEVRKRIQDRFEDAFFREPTDQELIVNVTGSGDPIASKVFRDFLERLDFTDFLNMEINLQTNGVLLTPKVWQRLSNLHGHVHAIVVSLDAAREETYDKVRVGGDWSQLLKNMDALAAARQRGEFKILRIDFVVQASNYQEMPAFVTMGKAWQVDNIFFSWLINWGTWTPAEFAKHCIWDRNHPEFESFRAILRDPCFNDPVVDLSNLSEFRRTTG